MAALANNKRYGPDAEASNAIRHRVAWLRFAHQRVTGPEAAPAFEQALRERTA
jgi:hypothetical protein